jgi:hypothetical protein|tara:strand:- start:5436 stop:6230 length:795 start_codon:yes stop_codon:yes gene_type:complete
MKFFISYNDYNCIIGYARAADSEFDSEIGGMAIMQDIEDGMLVTNPVILKQTVSGGSCDLDKESLANYYTKAAMKHGDVRFLWWHSHGDSSVFFSDIDSTTISESPTSDFTVSLVVNTKGKNELRIDVFHPVHMYIKGCLSIIDRPDDPADAVMEEVRKLCNVKRIKSYLNSRSSGNIISFSRRSIIIDWVKDVINEFDEGEIKYGEMLERIADINKTDDTKAEKIYFSVPSEAEIHSLVGILTPYRMMKHYKSKKKKNLFSAK